MVPMYEYARIRQAHRLEQMSIREPIHFQTQIFGNSDNDTFTLNELKLYGQTFIYGGDGQDRFTVNKLKTLNTSRPFTLPDGTVITRRDTLDLDGQAGA